MLVRIQGKHFAYIVLHGILSVEDERFLIVSHIYGITIKIGAQA